MAIGWMTVLKLVPWGEVIKNAPAVADGARKLWDSVGQRAEPSPAAATPTDRVGTDGADAAGADTRRLGQAEAEIRQLHEQMHACSALIKALAEQNRELVARVETHRVRVGWLAAAVAVFAAIAGLNLAVTFAR